MSVRSPIGFVLAALVMAGCAGGPPAPAPQPRGDGDEPLVSERRDARTRAQARTELAAAYYGTGNIAVALEEIRIALEADQNYAPAHNVHALVQMELRDPGAAERSFRRALDLAPNDPDVNHNYGWFLCQNGRERDSIALFMRAAANPLYTTPAKSYSTAGVCLTRMKRDAEAVANFERALVLDPSYAPAALPLARLYMQQGTLDRARELVSRLNNTLQPSAESLWVALNIERRRGDAQAEESLATQLRRRFPDARETQALQRGQYE